MINSEKMEQLTDDAIMHIFPRMQQLEQWQLSRTCTRLRGLYLYYRTTSAFCTFQQPCTREHNVISERGCTISRCAAAMHLICLSSYKLETTDDFILCAHGAAIGGHLDLLIMALNPRRSPWISQRIDTDKIAIDHWKLYRIRDSGRKHDNIVAHLTDMIENSLAVVIKQISPDDIEIDDVPDDDQVSYAN
jgi:hypothetical protein